MRHGWALRQSLGPYGFDGRDAASLRVVLCSILRVADVPATAYPWIGLP